jgi:ribulose-5-phosphate 4-epimerase/fuculose-1-phosphate aldolase
MSSEGVIKFVCTREEAPPPDAQSISELMLYRNKLYEMNLIGFDGEVGYGNISIRTGSGDNPCFIISGSQTGHIEKIKPEHFTEVISYNIKANTLLCRGVVNASSESLTHAAVYQSKLEVKCVIHVHNLDLWAKYLGSYPSTSESAEYGTPEMAYEIMRLTKESLPDNGIIIMAGHEGGIISYGETPRNAFSMLNSILS